jgi:hypothetical protein
VLFVYFTYTQQSLKVAEAMAAVLRDRGCEVRLAGIELTDSRFADRFSRFPLRHALFDILEMMPAQLRSATGEIRIPDEASDGGYDLVVIGSPTWWIRTSVPIRSCRDQVRSLLSLISYFGKGENRARYLGVKIPPTNLKPDYLGQAQAFATRLADGLPGSAGSADADSALAA